MSEIVSELESTGSKAPVKRSKIGIGILILVFLIGIAGIFYWRELNKQMVIIQPQKPSIPASIKLALDNFENSTDTGISLQDYPNLIIALKTATSTEGSLLTTQQQKELSKITYEMDMSFQLWQTSHYDDYDSANDMGDSTLTPALKDWLMSLNVDLTTLKHEGRNYPYRTDEVMSHVWNAIGVKIELFELEYKAHK